MKHVVSCPSTLVTFSVCRAALTNQKLLFCITRRILEPGHHKSAVAATVHATMAVTVHATMAATVHYYHASLP